MLQEVGHCKGIENYTRHLRAPRQATAVDARRLHAPDADVLDESHVMIGQLGGMYNGDRSRKQTLVDYGFRLPSALDNRPLKFEEFERKMRQAVFVSATPADYEQRMARRSSSSSSGRPAWSIRRSRSARARPRSTTYCRRSGARHG